MLVRTGIENENEGRSIAWALEHPGCFAYGRDAQEAQAGMSQAVLDYAAWIHAHGGAWLPLEPPQVQVEEIFDPYYVPRPLPLPPGASSSILVESFFRHDRQPLTGMEVERALQLFAWGRQDLLDTLKGLGLAELNRTYAQERWSINGILKHIAGGEWWYQERLGWPFPDHEEDLPADPLASLEMVRGHFTSLLPRLVGVEQVLEVEGEPWSPRKVLRRAAWHERDHTGHIRKLLSL